MTAPTRTVLPPVVCASWCDRGDGHPDVIFLGDQTCMSPNLGIVLDDAEGGIGAGAYAVRPPDGAPSVVVYDEMPGTGTRHSEAQARALAAEILAAADLIADAPPRPGLGGAASAVLTDLCAGCGDPVDLTAPHVTIARHVAQLGADDTVTVHDAQVLATEHLGCGVEVADAAALKAVAAGRLTAIRGAHRDPPAGPGRR